MCIHLVILLHHLKQTTFWNAREKWLVQKFTEVADFLVDERSGTSLEPKFRIQVFGVVVEILEICRIDVFSCIYSKTCHS